MNIPLHSMTALQRAYDLGDLTPAQVVEEVFQRINQAHTSDPAIWIALRDLEAVLAEAKSLQGLGAAKLPLYGIPFAVKDNIDVGGMPTTAACPEFAYTPVVDATVVSQLRAAGALLIGKTNLDQFATGLVGVRSPYGAPRSPFNLEYISGGSSSGSAVSVSRALVSFSLGTDTAGSGRVPAAMNNIVGLKPTKGLLSTSGVVPACRSLDCVSIFATTAGDAARVLAVVARYDTQDPYSRRSSVPFPVTLPVLPGHLSIAVPRADQREFCGDDASAALFEKAIAEAQARGATVTEIDFAPFAEVAALLYQGAWVAERTAAVGAFLDIHPGVGDSVVRGIIEGGKTLSAVDAFKASYRLEVLRKACAAVWQDHDALLVPTAPTAYKVAAVQADPLRLNATLGLYTNFVNFLDLAAVAVPFGFAAEGMPRGVTVIAPAYSDRGLLALADALHRSDGTAKAGASGEILPAAGNIGGSWSTAMGRVAIVLVGAHMRGLPLNPQITSLGGRLITETTTAPAYKLYALTHLTPIRPGMVRVGEGEGAAIAVEVWDMPAPAFATFVDQITPPLGIGWVTLADGQNVLGFLCEQAGTTNALDITAQGGWRRYCQSVA